MERSSSPSSSEAHPTHWLPLPKNYKVLNVLGDGGFGTVVKCTQQGTKQPVAVKVQTSYSDFYQEALIMKVLMDHGLDKFNIIKFHDEFLMNNRLYLVFEVLDISLQDYLMDLDSPMYLKDIRTVIEQMATALDALKRVGVIHTDVKIDNIMMVDHLREPFKVKLIDFGLAVLTSQAKRNRNMQTAQYRAPEIILGLPFSEAIDMWSLGCVMAIMMLGKMLFPAGTSYDTLRYMIDLLGLPPDHLINAGLESHLYFQKTDCDEWEFLMHQERDNVAEADERSECTELLKAMLRWDERERISPSGVLHHPFITRSFLSSRSPHRSCNTSADVHLDNSTLRTASFDGSKDQEENNNCFRRFFFWMLKTCCCIVVDDRSEDLHEDFYCKALEQSTSGV